MLLDKKTYSIYLAAAVITGMLLFMLGSLIFIINDVNSGSSADLAQKERSRKGG